MCDFKIVRGHENKRVYRWLSPALSRLFAAHQILLIVTFCIDKIIFCFSTIYILFLSITAICYNEKN